MKLITIATFNTPHEAYLAKGKLDTIGIHTQLSNEFEVFTNWLCSNLNDGIKLQVPEDQVFNAIEIINSDIYPYDIDENEWEIYYSCEETESEHSVDINACKPS